MAAIVRACLRIIIISRIIRVHRRRSIEHSRHNPRTGRAATEIDPRATILSVDATGAYDHVSGRPCSNTPASSMALPAPTRGLMGRGPPTPSRRARVANREPLMPALYSLAQHPALQGAGTAAGWRGDLSVCRILSPRIHELYEAYRRALWALSRVELSSRRTRVWNTAGEEPPRLSVLQGDADTAIWVGDWALPPQQQGLTVLGTPFGSDAYVRLRLAQTHEEHDRLLQRIPLVMKKVWLGVFVCNRHRHAGITYHHIVSGRYLTRF